jgi:acyl-coenzyme A synthetase/AMP-(fatty) acid ligase
MLPVLNQFTLVDDNFPECGIDCSDWIEKFDNILQTFNNDLFTRIVLISEKNVFSISMIHAAKNAGFPYIPIDIHSPIGRISTIIQQLEPEIYFIQKRVIDFNAEIFKDLFIIWESNNFLVAKNLKKSAVQHSPDLAFILFTSGSTGIPKGVMMSKQNVNCFVEWTINEFNITKDSKVLAVAPLHFDLSVFDLYATYTTKASLFLPLQGGLVNPLYLAQLISIYKIDTIYATPTWFDLLIKFGKLKRFDFSFVKTIMVAGEALKILTVQSISTFFPNAKISNLYGPTETNVCSFYTIDLNDISSNNGIASIGKACPYAQLRMNNQNVLEVSGQSVMLGYWPHSFNETWYNTGDVVKYGAATGNYFYLERADRMIKRNGYRIEPAEIETALLIHNQLEQVAVVAKQIDDTVQIIAHYTTKTTNEVPDLHEFCVNNLPTYMVPDKFILHSQLPITSSGKTDYKKLMES